MEQCETNYNIRYLPVDELRQWKRLLKAGHPSLHSTVEITPVNLSCNSLMVKHFRPHGQVAIDASAQRNMIIIVWEWWIDVINDREMHYTIGSSEKWSFAWFKGVKLYGMKTS